MRAFPAIAVALLLPLVGCGDKGVEAKNESPAEVAKKIATSDVRFNPGRWETTVKFEKLDVGEDLPPQAKAAMEQAMAKTRTVSSCLTKAQAEKPDGAFFGQEDDRCKFDSFTMAGGRLDAKMTCKTEQAEQVMTMGGTYTPDTYDLTMEMNGKGPTGKPMSMAMAMKSKHTGECTGNEDAPAAK